MCSIEYPRPYLRRSSIDLQILMRISPTVSFGLKTLHNPVMCSMGMSDEDARSNQTTPRKSW